MTSLLLLAVLAQGELRVPGFTAYLEPNPDAFEMDEKKGLIGWNDPKTRVAWFGKLAQAGELRIKVRFDSSAHANRFKMTVDGQTRSVLFTDPREGEASFTVAKPGYKKILLEAVGKKGEMLGTPAELVLGGPAAEGAHFNLEPRRNAASVHLGYPIPEDAKVVKFYNEITPREEPVHSYYMACGFKRGYFGIQVNGPTERRIIFSIWDSGAEANDRNKVGQDDRVRLLAKGDGVVAGDFGNEGTGGHSHQIYPWKNGQTYRFCVVAKPEGTATIYSGYFWFPEKKAWGLIASFRAPKDGGYLRGLYSFNENFWGNNGHLRRLAEFRNQWIETEDGVWSELTKARFTHDGTGKVSRKDYAAGAIRDGFYLSNGGFVDNGVKYGDTFDRKPAGKRPDVVGLPR